MWCVFLWKYISVFEKLYFSFERSNMHIFTLNIAWVAWPHVTNLLDLRYFCCYNPLFNHLNLITCPYWSWQRNIYFLVNILSDILFLCRKVASRQGQFKQWLVGSCQYLSALGYSQAFVNYFSQISSVFKIWITRAYVIQNTSYTAYKQEKNY